MTRKTNIALPRPLATSVSGHRLRRNHFSPKQKAKMGASIYEGKRPVDRFTLDQTANLVGVAVSAINAERTEPKRRYRFNLAKALARATPEDAAAAVTVLGGDYIFSLFFEPGLPLHHNAL
jgi:hypothetical protein